MCVVCVCVDYKCVLCVWIINVCCVVCVCEQYFGVELGGQWLWW